MLEANTHLTMALSHSSMFLNAAWEYAVNHIREVKSILAEAHRCNWPVGQVFSFNLLSRRNMRPVLRVRFGPFARYSMLYGRVRELYKPSVLQCPNAYYHLNCWSGLVDRWWSETTSKNQGFWLKACPRYCLADHHCSRKSTDRLNRLEIEVRNSICNFTVQGASLKPEGACACTHPLWQTARDS